MEKGKINLQVEYININDLVPYSKNAKLHPKEQVEQIKKSISEFGMNDPIAIGKDNLIVEGHGRLIACKELNITEVPIIRLDHLTDEERKAYTLAHNKLTMNSDFNIDILNDELDDILNIDMTDFGFDIVDDDTSYIDDLLDEEFVGTSISNQFSVTFLFNKDYQNPILDFIKENGKDAIVENIINFVEGKNA